MDASAQSRNSLWCLALPALAVVLFSGCTPGNTQETTSFLAPEPTAAPLVVCAQAPSTGIFGSVAPAPSRLVVRPQECTIPVQTQQLIIATVYAREDTPCRKRRVEWVLEGAGSIVAVDEGSLLSGRGFKTDTHSAVSFTNFSEHLFTRGNLDPSDDFVIRPGQTWCVISSAVEGDSYVTVTAPEIDNWDNRKVVATTHWVDAEWRLPPPVIARSGTPHVVTTQVLKRSNHQPLTGYRVRYRVLDGPSAAFLPSQAQEVVAVTDLSGEASATLVQREPRGGVNRVSVEIIRPPDRLTPAGTGLVLNTGETRIDWQGAQLNLSQTAPPAAALGQEGTFALTVSNNGHVECQEITLRDTLPDGLQYVRSEPSATVDGKQLVWTLPGLKAGHGHTVNAVFRGAHAGPVSNLASLKSHEGLQAESKARSEVTVPQLAVKMTGPDNAVVGVPATFTIVVSNPGTGAASNVVLLDEFDAGLDHDSQARWLRLPVGPLAPGENRSVPLTLTPKQAGQLANRVKATADNNLSAAADHALKAQKASLSVDVKGTQKSYVDRQADWTITVVNTGEAALTNVLVHDMLPPELAYVSADQGGTATLTQATWNLGMLKPNEKRELALKTRCVRVTPRALNVAVATADPGLKVQQEAVIEINGMPAFHLEVHDTADPVEVGGKTSYRIDVDNQGTLAGTQVEVVAVVPPQLKVLSTGGTAQGRIEGNTPGQPQKVTFPPLASLAPGQRATYQVDVQALTPGDVRFHVELRSATLSREVVEEESTTIFRTSNGTATPAPTTTEPPTRSPAPARPPG